MFKLEGYDFFFLVCTGITASSLSRDVIFFENVFRTWFCGSQFTSMLYANFMAPSGCLSINLCICTF